LLPIEVMLQERVWRGGLRGRECLSGGEPGRGLVYWDLCVEEGCGDGTSLHSGPIGTHGGGVSVQREL